MSVSLLFQLQEKALQDCLFVQTKRTGYRSWCLFLPMCKHEEKSPSTGGPFHGDVDVRLIDRFGQTHIYTDYSEVNKLC